MTIDKINVSEKLKAITDYWNPRIAGRLNGQLVKLVKFKGEFIWHKHDDEDELFWVLEGSFKMELRNNVLILNKGEFVIIPKGIEHRPVATEEVHILLFEPDSTLNTGNRADSVFTKNELSEI